MTLEYPESDLEMPALFLYRHAVEVMIKGIVQDIGGQKISKVHPLGHHQSELTKVAADYGITLSHEFHQVIELLDGIDRKSLRARYPSKPLQPDLVTFAPRIKGWCPNFS